MGIASNSFVDVNGNFIFDKLRDIVIKIQGYDPCTDSRNHNVILAKCIFIGVLYDVFARKSGQINRNYVFSHPDITATSMAKFLGRDHASVLHLKRTGLYTIKHYRCEAEYKIVKRDFIGLGNPRMVLEDLIHEKIKIDKSIKDYLDKHHLNLDVYNILTENIKLHKF